MRLTCKKIISLLLTLIFVANAVLAVVPCALAETEYDYLSLDTCYTVTPVEGVYDHTCLFVPESDGYYTFYSESEGAPAIVVAKNDLPNGIAHYSGEDDFNLTIPMYEGVTYFITTYLPDESIPYDFYVTKYTETPSIQIEDGKDITIHLTESVWLSAYFMPSHVEVADEITWTIDDESVGTIDTDGDFQALLTGDTTVTATTEMGLTSSITIHVVDFPSIEAEKNVQISLLDSMAYESFTFVPKETGLYRIESANSKRSPGCSLVKCLPEGGYEPVNSVYSNLDGHNFRLQETLTAGSKYILMIALYGSYRNDSFTISIKKMNEATSVSIDQGDSIAKTKYEYCQLSASFLPTNSLEQSYIWYSEDDTIASVSKNGLLNFNKVGKTTIWVETENGLCDSIAVETISPNTISLNEKVSLTYEKGVTYQYYSFTPAEDGVYSLHSEGDYDTSVALLDEDGQELEYDDDGGHGYNFRLDSSLTAGKTYVYEITCEDHSKTAQFDVQLLKLDYPTSIVVTPNPISDHIRSSTELEYRFEPEYSIQIPVSFTSDDEDIAFYDDGYIFFVNVGSTYIHATTDTGLDVSIPVTVNPPKEAVLGKNSGTLALNEEGHVYTFTPEQDGTYMFYSKSAFDIALAITLENNELIASDDDSGEERNFLLRTTLTGGETYLLFIGNYEYDSVVPYEFYIEKLSNPTAISFAEGSSVSTYPQAQQIFNVIYSPANSIQEELAWTIDDEELGYIYSSENACLFVGSKPGETTIHAKSESGLETSCKITVLQPETILVGDSKTVFDDSSDPDTIVFSFTPTERGYYEFYSTGTVNADGYVYSATGSSYCDSSTDPDGKNFHCVGYLYNDVEYYLACFVDDDIPTPFDVHLIKQTPATSIKIVQGETIYGHPNGHTYLDYAFYPEHSSAENITWKSSDLSVAQVDEDGIVGFVGIGEANITVTSQNNLSATCHVVVTDYPSISDGETKSIPLNAQNEVSETYRFVPEETGDYLIKTADSGRYYFNILSEDFDGIKQEYSEYNEGGLTLACRFEKGETYYIEVQGWNLDENAQDVKISLTKEEPLTSISFQCGKSASMDLLQQAYFSILSSPNNAYINEHNIQWTISDPAVASINNYGVVTALKEGTFTLTAKYNGCTASCSITVDEPDWLSLQCAKDVKLNPLCTTVYRFIAPCNGSYTFYSFGPCDTNCKIYNEDLLPIAKDEDSGVNENFKLTYNLTAGETCYLCIDLDGYNYLDAAIMVSLSDKEVKAYYPTAKKGDLDNNGSIDLKDVLALRKNIAGIDENIAFDAANVLSDTLLDLKDVLLLRKYIAKQIPSI